MSKYVDGFVLPIRKDRLNEYRELAENAGQIWKEYGALEYIECAGDGLHVQQTPCLAFPKMASATDEETVVFAWIVYESREHRDEVNGKVMADPRMKNACESGQHLFDPARMAYGGFKTIVEA